MDCNRCEYLNITEDEQREMGNKKGHYCKECDIEDDFICILDNKGSVLSYYWK